MTEWAYLRAGLGAVGLLVMVALAAWGIATVRYEDPGFRRLMRCLIEEKGVSVAETHDPIARSAELGALETVIETNDVTVSVADDEEEAQRIVSRYLTVADDLGSRVELRGRTVYLWDRPPSPTQRQTLFDCTY